MDRTPGLVVPSAYSSEEALLADVRRRGEEAGYTPFDPSAFDEDEPAEERKQ